MKSDDAINRNDTVINITELDITRWYDNIVTKAETCIDVL